MLSKLVDRFSSPTPEAEAETRYGIEDEEEGDIRP